jgi:hypothetical protein
LGNHWVTTVDNQGSMLWSQFSAIFDNFRLKKVALFLKTNVMIKICKNYQHFVQKSQFFGGNIFISVPSYAELILILS